MGSSVLIQDGEAAGVAEEEILQLLHSLQLIWWESKWIPLHVIKWAIMSHSNGSSLQFVNETDNIIAESNGGGLYSTGMKRSLDDSDSDSGTPHLMQNAAPVDGPKPGKKTKGRVKIKMEFIENKLRRYTTFSKRKTGIMKKVNNFVIASDTHSP